MSDERKVVPIGKLRKCEAPARKPDPDVVALCKMLLREAEAGHVRAVAVAIDMADDSTSYNLQYSDGTRARSLLGALALLEDDVKALCRKPSDGQ